NDEQRVRTQELDASDVVVDAVVEITNERAALENDALGTRAHLRGAHGDDAAVISARGLIVQTQSIDRRRMLDGVEILAGRRVDRVVGWIAGNDEPGVARRKWPQRWENYEVIAKQPRDVRRQAVAHVRGAGAEVEYAVHPPGPDAIVVVKF